MPALGSRRAITPRRCAKNAIHGRGRFGMVKRLRLAVLCMRNTRLCCPCRRLRRQHWQARKRPDGNDCIARKMPTGTGFLLAPTPPLPHFVVLFTRVRLYLCVYFFVSFLGAHVAYACPLPPTTSHTTAIQRVSRDVIETTMPKPRDCDGYVFGRGPKIKTKTLRTAARDTTMHFFFGHWSRLSINIERFVKYNVKKARCPDSAEPTLKDCRQFDDQ